MSELLVITPTCTFPRERPSEARAQLGEALIVSSFAELFCDQFAHSLRLCLRLLPLFPRSRFCVK